MVEPTAARLAAERSSAGQHAELDLALDALVDSSVELDAFIEADLVLHGLIFQMSGNPLLEELITPIEAALRVGRRVQASGAGEVARSPADAIGPHRAVVEAIVAGEAAAAEVAMRMVVQAAADDVRSARDRAGGERP